ncbi:methylthioribose kinase [Paenibacillus sp. J31TS4]|uniref:S-methyl-5-thioribose kinase n=1 Tax=Paenibacillus sp. J31TS4 TaxID=2807195 RepID=UPI001B0D57E1|nr:S-methyl-5-thioribose kinase [Paenibacillus sp. J31TS4]GIP38349.1 methylthioribose kinase [Paenibacillus sp. J31TS4]
MSQYHALTLEEAVAYARELPNLFAPDAELSVREIGDGNLNLVFHIQDATSQKSIIMKQAVPYAKVVGESWPLSLERARIESEALQLHESLCPGLVPHVFAYDHDLALTVMEDLSDHVIMRRGLSEGNRYPLFAGHIGEFLARTLFFTSDLGMDQQQKKENVRRFINPDLCKITEDLIFDDPYTDSPNNSYNPLIEDAAESLRTDTALHLEVALLREAFLTHAESLLHGDLHTGSIFVTEESTKVIDPEFAYYGPMGFDIGAVLANLLLNLAAQTGRMPDEAARVDFQRYLLGTVRDVWDVFETTFTKLWEEHCVDRIARTPGYREVYLKKVLRDTAGFTGAKMVRRIVGLAHVSDIEGIEDPEVRARAERLALAIGRALILKGRQVESIEEIIATAEQAAGLA